MDILPSCDRIRLLLFLWVSFITCGFSSVNYCPKVGPGLVTCQTDFCQRVTCPPPIHCPKGSVAENGSICGCLDACVKYLDEGESCSSEKLHLGISKRRCKYGLFCNDDGICSLNKTKSSCINEVKWRKYLINPSSDAEIKFSPDLWIPECDEKGFYKIKQCKKKKCFCVDETGIRLFGQEQRHLAINMTCGCSRQMADLRKKQSDTWMTKPQQHCSNTGDYEDLQCLDDICCCVDSITGQCSGRVTKMAFIDMLPCYDAKKNSKMYVTQCEKELIRTRSLTYQFKQKNITITGLEAARCDIDGTFAPKQCQTSRCVCTDRDGVGIKSYHVEKKKREVEIQQMTCRCARDEYDREALHALYPTMNCEENGNFVPLQCNENDCICVDEDGDALTDELPKHLAHDDWSTYCTKAVATVKTPFKSDFLESTTVGATTDDSDNEYYDYR